MRHFELFIDESGNVNPVDKLSQIYVLCGCAIAQEQRLNLKILGDLFCFLKEASYTIFVIVCDKNKAGEKGWNSLKVIKETAHRLFYHYIVWLLGLKNDRGKITIESATAEKDRAAQCKYFRETKQKTYKVGSYEDRIIRILDGRLFKRPRFAKKEKMKFYEAIEPFCLIPK